MKKRYILLLLFSLVLVGASAQTLEQAKAFLQQGAVRESQTRFQEIRQDTTGKRKL